MSSTVQSLMVNGSSDPSVVSINPSTTAHSGAQSSEVLATKRRRTISPSDKRRILLAYDRCKNPGERGALMRRERVYSSMISGWRKHEKTALATPRRGPKSDPAVAQRNRDEQLNRQIVRLQRQLERANLIIDAQKKLCALLGLPNFEEQEAEKK